MSDEAEQLAASDDIAAEAELLRRSFADFAEYFWPRMTNGRPYPKNAATSALAAALQAVADGRIWRLLVAIAPGIGKSTMLALYSAWRLARRHEWKGMHAMNASGNAKRESHRVRRLVQHADFRRFFPRLALADDEQAIEEWATTRGGRYFALGLDTAITSKRVDELVCDDLMNATDRRSKTERDRVWSWLDDAAMSRLDGDFAPVIVVAQRLDRDDIHARCFASGGAWVILEPAAARDDRGLELRDHAGNLVWADTREPDELIAPQMFGREKLEGLSKSVRTTQYQQRPDEDSGAGAIDRTAWRFHAPAGANPNAARPNGCASPDVAPTIETPARFDTTVISCDPTFGGTKSSNDFAAIQVWGSSGPGRFLLARWKQRAKQREQRAQLKVLRATFPGAKILIERAAGGDGMIEELEAERVTNIEGVTVGSQTGGKAARLDNVSPTIEQGFAYLPIGMHDLQGFVDELAGMTVHDDDMDACSQALHWLNVNDAPPPRERWAALSNTNYTGAWRGASHGREPTAEQLAQLERERAADAERAVAAAERHGEAMRALDARERAGEKLSYVDRYQLRTWRARARSDR